MSVVPNGTNTYLFVTHNVRTKSGVVNERKVNIMKILGIVNSQGDFNGNKYHNLVLHCSYKETNERKDCCGELTDVVKLRFSDLNALFSMGLADPSDVEKMTAANFDYLLGEEIEVSYNKFGAVQGVTILDSKDKSKERK